MDETRAWILRGSRPARPILSVCAAAFFGAHCFAVLIPSVDENGNVSFTDDGTTPEVEQMTEMQSQGGPAKPQSPEEKAIAEFLKLTFDRSPASILQAQSALASPPTPAPKPPELFRLNVVAGRWKEAGALLKTVPEKSAPILYQYLLTGLNRAPVGDPAQQQQLRGPAILPTLLQQDILDLADIAPKELTDEQLKLLGALLTRAIERNTFLDPLLKRLEDGTAAFGGKDTRKRERAAQLLLNANRDLEAVRFLPALAPGREAASFPLLEKHVRCAFTKGRAETDKDAIARAWQLNQTMLAATDCPADFRERASLRNAELLPFLPTAETTQWLKETFAKQPAMALKILVSTGQQIAKGRTQRETAIRQRSLDLQRQIVDALRPAAERRAQWQAALNLFATNWMEEAEYSKRFYTPPQDQNNQTDMYGSRVFYNNQSAQNLDPNMLPPVPLPDVMPGAPDAAWLAAIDPSLLPRALTLLAEVHLKMEDDAKALPFIEQTATLQPKEAQRLGNDLLRMWANGRDPSRAMQQQQRMYYNQGMYMGQQQQGIPLTRALQQRHLEDLSAILKRLRALPMPALDDAAIVTAFTAAHSPAEVFREDAIELALGKVQDIKAETLAGLLQTMRERLAGQWRKPDVQQQAKTQRTDVQIDAEVLGGYELLSKLIAKGLERQADDWQLNLTQAATLFDWAEFQYGKKVDLAIYVEKRERAFEAFQRAAELYAAKVPSLEKKDESPLVYQMWLNANLGASDLAMVTRQQEPSMNQLDRVRTALRALPGDAVGRHLDLLAKSVRDSSGSIPANLKSRYMTAALRIIGERPASEEIRRLVDYHKGLLREIEVSTRIDGDTEVGHGKAFGVFLTVRHTAELERENQGGFGKYLQNQSQNGYFSRYGIAPVDYRDDLEKQIREKLSEGFEIVSITFHDDKVQSRGYGRAGWRETPLVYLLLKAKDASVDRIPSLRLDVDFLDKSGPVVLPVESAVQLIDARSDKPAARPVATMEFTQTLDDRALKEGKLALEVKATARGLVPDFAELFDFSPAGFKIEETEDSGTAVQRLDSEKDEIAPVSERNWVIKMRAENSTGGSTRFEFPKPKRNDMKVACKRYVDADVAEATPELALSGVPLNRARLWQWGLLGTGALAGGFFLVKSLRKRDADAPEKVAYELPAAITPFTALDLLRRMHADEALKLSPEQRGELSKAITDIEAYHFSPSRNGSAEPDLTSIGKHWVSRVAR